MTDSNLQLKRDFRHAIESINVRLAAFFFNLNKEIEMWLDVDRMWKLLQVLKGSEKFCCLGGQKICYDDLLLIFFKVFFLFFYWEKLSNLFRRLNFPPESNQTQTNKLFSIKFTRLQIQLLLMTLTMFDFYNEIDEFKVAIRRVKTVGKKVLDKSAF